MKKKILRLHEQEQKEALQQKARLDRAIMNDLERSFYSVKEALLKNAGSHMLICIYNALDFGDAVNAEEIARFAKLAKKALPVELHRAWDMKWKDITWHALKGVDSSLMPFPLKEWGLI